ncbi:MAG TPA: hypothetical protein VFF04_00560 [Candidatus Babeliales bacterium]|nr:hypothetical protein [Candidatus Babeliales bacterium]
MPTITIFLSIITGIISGIIYGLFFLLQRRRVFSLDATSYRFHALNVIFSATRILLLAVVWYYLLLSPSINLILLVTSFLGVFWLTILTAKA